VACFGSIGALPAVLPERKLALGRLSEVTKRIPEVLRLRADRVIDEASRIGCAASDPTAKLAQLFAASSSRTILRTSS